MCLRLSAAVGCVWVAGRPARCPVLGRSRDSRIPGMMPPFRYFEASVKGLAGHFDSLSANYGCLPPGVQHYVFLLLNSSDFQRFE